MRSEDIQDNPDIVAFRQRVRDDLNDLVGKLRTTHDTNPMPTLQRMMNERYKSFSIPARALSEFGYSFERFMHSLLEHAFMQAGDNGIDAFFSTGALGFFTYYVGGGEFITEVTHCKCHERTLISRPVLRRADIDRQIRITSRDDMPNVSRIMYLRSADTVRLLREDEVENIKNHMLGMDAFPMRMITILMHNTPHELQRGFARYMNRVYQQFEGSRAEQLHTLSTISFLFDTFPDIPEEYEQIREMLLRFAEKTRRGITFRSFARTLNLYANIHDANPMHVKEMPDGSTYYCLLDKREAPVRGFHYTFTIGRRTPYQGFSMVCEISIEEALANGGNARVFENGSPERRLTMRIEQDE